MGDLVFYGKPAVHVGVYVGGGRMVDASRLLGRVVRRQVFASETVRFGRLLPARR
jgi:peptidoglycan DL-endopeptidase CwlO